MDINGCYKPSKYGIYWWLLPTNIGLENLHFEWLKFLQMSRIGRPALGTTHSTLL
jgi:hypothetical protein